MSLESYVCVNCEKSSKNGRAFTSNYRVRENNRDRYSDYFDKDLSLGSLCDSCYQTWYMYCKKHPEFYQIKPRPKRRKNQSTISPKKRKTNASTTILESPQENTMYTIEHVKKEEEEEADVVALETPPSPITSSKEFTPPTSFVSDETLRSTPSQFHFRNSTAPQLKFNELSHSTTSSSNTSRIDVDDVLSLIPTTSSPMSSMHKPNSISLTLHNTSSSHQMKELQDRIDQIYSENAKLATLFAKTLQEKDVELEKLKKEFEKKELEYTTKVKMLEIKLAKEEEKNRTTSALRSEVKELHKQITKLQELL